MSEMRGICGIRCSDCQEFIVTRDGDERGKRRLAELWSTEEEPLGPGDIECDGCLAVDGRRTRFCRECEVRRCGLERGVVSCAHCEEYSCEKLDKLLEMFTTGPVIRETLEEIRESP